MKGLGTDATSLNFNIVRVIELGLMEKTKAAFFAKYGSTLASWIKGDASGLWAKLLLQLVGADDPTQYGGKSAVTFEVVARGDEITRAMLKSDDVFVFDTGFEVFAWCGKSSSAFERRTALHYAQQYLASAALPQTTPISRIVEGGSNAVFEASFQHGATQ